MGGNYASIAVVRSLYPTQDDQRNGVRPYDIGLKNEKRNGHSIPLNPFPENQIIILIQGVA